MGLLKKSLRGVKALKPERRGNLGRTGLTIDRQDYGVSWNRTLDAGGVVVDNEVEITLEQEFNQAG